MRQLVAVVGDSLGGLTQLLWYFACREQARLDGVELWLRRQNLGAIGVGGLFQDAGRYVEKLFSVLGDAADRLPAWELVPRVNPPLDDPPGRGFVVYAPETAAEFRRDVALRLDTLTRSSAALIGGIAGDDAPRTAALVQAFTAFARPSDRIVAVRLDPRVAVTTDVKAFVCPEGPIAFVPPEDQVTVEPVWFEARSALVARARLGRAEHMLALERARLASPEGQVADDAAFGIRRLGARYAEIRLGDRPPLRVGQDTMALFEALLAVAPQPVARSRLAAIGRRTREKDSVDRMLNTLRRRLEARGADDPRWIQLVPRRHASGLWWVEGAVGVHRETATRSGRTPQRKKA